MAAAHFVDGRRRGGIAGHHQRFDVVLLTQVLGDGVGARSHKSVAALAIRGVGAIGQVHKTFVGQGCQQRSQHAQPADAAVKYTDGRRSLRHREPSSGSGETGIVGKTRSLRGHVSFKQDVSHYGEMKKPPEGGFSRYGQAASKGAWPSVRVSLQPLQCP